MCTFLYQLHPAARSSLDRPHLKIDCNYRQRQHNVLSMLPPAPDTARHFLSLWLMDFAKTNSKAIFIKYWLPFPFLRNTMGWKYFSRCVPIFIILHFNKIFMKTSYGKLFHQTAGAWKFRMLLQKLVLKHYKHCNLSTNIYLQSAVHTV